MANQKKNKPGGKPKLKITTHLPIAALVGIQGRTIGATITNTKLKGKAGGGFIARGSTQFSGINATRAPEIPKGTVLDLLQAWNGVAMGNGWDPEYVNSFLENEDLPPTHDPELPTRSREPGDNALREWTKEMDTFVKHMITLEGRGRNAPSSCQRCRKSDLVEAHRCLSCTSMGLVCKECLIEAHADNPLHRVQTQRWNGISFGATTLKILGLRVQLGHCTGDSCPTPERTRGDDFVVLDLDHVHSVSLDFCGCGHAGTDHVGQLMEHRFWPATVENPKTAATFRLLEHFEILQYESKISPFEVWSTISRLTDNTGIDPPKDRYPSLIRMVHEFRQVRMLKRAGRGHDPDRPPSQTEEGECAVLCPPCPHPGINMEPGWESASREDMYLHALNIGLDANFRLKRKDVSSDAADPGLSRGWGYFVEDTQYRKYLQLHEDDIEPKSDCSRHDAVNLADTRPGQGYAATGVGTVECTRHNMKRPSAVGDLQKGERYSNMDYFLIRSIMKVSLKMFLISYDIACQWGKGLFERLAKIDKACPLLQPGVVTRFAVPKFHLPAHIPVCRSRFAFMLTPGAALGDGEAPERGWAEANPLGPSTREMGPGTRRDTLDFNFSDYNWRKIVNLGKSLLKKLETATGSVVEHVVAHQELDASVREEYNVQEWEDAIVSWELDPSMPNPYELTIDTPTQAAVRRELSDEEKLALDRGEDLALTDEISPASLIAWGIDLEEEQRAVRRQSSRLWDHAKDRQISRTQFRTNTLVRKIETWYRLLQIYVPGTAMLRHQDSGKAKSAFDLPLYLPSSVGSKINVDPKLLKIEYRLRFAQAHEALGTIRRNLQIRATLYDAKNRWARGQGANTRALNAIATVQARINAAATEYRQARKAVIALTPLTDSPSTAHIFLPLEDGDLRSMTEVDSVPMAGPSNTNSEPAEATPGNPQKGSKKSKHKGKKGKAGKIAGPRGETRRTLSWIWRAVGSTKDLQNDFAADTMRVEWGKSRARAQRYQEEIKLVKEEMNRTIRFFIWQEAEWGRRASAWVGRDITPEYAEGLNAYAARQASLCRSLHNSFTHQWNGVDRLIATAEQEITNPDLHYKRKGIVDDVDNDDDDDDDSISSTVAALANTVINPSHDVC